MRIASEGSPKGGLHGERPGKNRLAQVRQLGHKDAAQRRL